MLAITQTAARATGIKRRFFTLFQASRSPLPRKSQKCGARLTHGVQWRWILYCRIENDNWGCWDHSRPSSCVDTTYGATYALARDNGGEFGFSNPISVLLAIPPPPSSNLVGLQGFQLGIIPEPSTSALIFIGGAALFSRAIRGKTIRTNRTEKETNRG